MRTAISPQFVDVIPDRLAEGVLYICERYRTVVHKCACGCGEEVVTPLSPVDWSIWRDGETVTLHPSIGNWGLPCRSHYWIRRNQVMWVKGMSDMKIQQVRERDRRDKQAYINQVNRLKDRGDDQSQKAQVQPRTPTSFTQWFLDLFKS